MAFVQIKNAVINLSEFDIAYLESSSIFLKFRTGHTVNVTFSSKQEAEKELDNLYKSVPKQTGGQF